MKIYRFEISSEISGRGHQLIHTSEIVAASLGEAIEIAELAAISASSNSTCIASLIDDHVNVVWSMGLPADPIGNALTKNRS